MWRSGPPRDNSDGFILSISSVEQDEGDGSDFGYWVDFDLIADDLKYEETTIEELKKIPYLAEAWKEIEEYLNA